MQRLSAFLLFLGDKKGIAPKSSIFFHPLIMNPYDLPSYGSESRKRYRRRLLLICLEEGGVLEVFLPEGVK